MHRTLYHFDKYSFLNLFYISTTIENFLRYPIEMEGSETVGHALLKIDSYEIIEF